jgi:ATP-dependent helicase/DNAse subunit B
MSITLITGPANSGKAQMVMESVRAHLAQGREPLLVVPTAADADHYTRELAGDGVAMGVQVERFAGLVAEAVRRAGIATPVLEGVGRERLIEALGARATRRSSTPGFVRALGDLFAELQVRRVSPARLLAALASWSAADGEDSVRARLGGLYADYRAALERLGRLDAEQRAVQALDALRVRPSLWGATPVLFYGFDDLTRLQLDAIETLGRLVDAEVTVSLAYEAGRTAFAGRAGTFQELSPLAGAIHSLPPREQHYEPSARRALGHLERSLFEPEAPKVEAGTAVRLLEAGSERAELELIAREIVVLIAGGTAPEEIALMARPPLVGSELVAEVFAAAGIPIAQQATRLFADTAIGRALMGLLRCSQRPDLEGGPSVADLGDLLAWLRAPGLLERPLLADRFEVRARRLGLHDAAEARALWEQQHWPLDAIDRLSAAAARGPLALIERAARELTRLFSAPRAGAAAVLRPAELQDARALSAGMRALAQLRELARGAPDLAPAGPAELAETIARIELTLGERPAPGLVSILDPLSLRARRVRALFVCSMQEGVFPARGREQPLLGEDERDRLAEVSGLRLDRELDNLAAERYLLYAAVSRPEQLLVLSWHVADDDGQPTSRSLFVDDVCDLFDASLSESRITGVLDAGERRAGIAPALSAPRRLTSEQLLLDMRERVWSASSLERWLGCPVAWFVERMLSPEALEPDAEPLAQGGLAHAALKDTLEGLRAATGSARVSVASLPRALELLGEALERNERLRPLPISAERAVALRRRLRVDLERYLEYAAEMPGALEPAELELGFGFDARDARGEGATLTALTLGEGMLVHGRIDRVDATPDGGAVVIDYKSGKATAVARWELEGKLQLPLYMLAVEQLLDMPARGGLYQPLSRNLQARGVLEQEAELELPSVRTDVLGASEVRDQLDRAAATAREIVREAREGKLEPRPRTCAWKGGCMYPSICRCRP